MPYIIFSLLILSCFIVETAIACTIPATVEQKLKESDLVFTGVVESVSCEPRNAKVVLLVEDIWKGEIEKSYILTYDNCTVVEDEYRIADPYLFNIKKDSKYLIYANKTKDGLFTGRSNTCPGSVQIIMPGWKVWLSHKYEQIVNMDFSSSFKSFQRSVYDDLKQLGKPKYIANNKEVL